MKLRNTVFAMLALSPALANAAVLDLSEQQVDALFEEGNYAQLSYARVMPKLEGTDATPTSQNGSAISDVANDYNKIAATVKFSAGENGNTAFLLKYDQPWGVDTKYTSGSLSGTKAKVTSDALTALVGYRTASNFWLYGGVEFQQSEGEVAVQLSNELATGSVLPAVGMTVAQYTALAQGVAAGTATATEQATFAGIQNAISGAASYTLDIDKNNTIAGVVGMAYEYPEIALRADLTYHSPAKYNSEIIENGVNSGNRMDFEFPQSVNLNFQTGIMADTLLMAKMRWVNWKNFVAAPAGYTSTRGTDLASYSKDQYSGSIGIGRRFTDKFSGQISFEYDSGAGKPYSVLGPYNDQKGVTVAGKYKINDMLDVAAGVNYTQLGDADIYSGTTQLASFKDGHSIGGGVQLGVHF